MSTRKSETLAERRNDLSRQLILNAAIDLLERPTGSVADLTFLAVAERAGISQRTVFRYFPSRDAFLDAVAEESRQRMALPAPPRTLAELLAAPRALYTAFEAKRNLVIGGLHTELAQRMRAGHAKARWRAIRAVIDELAPSAPEVVRMIAAANIRYYLAAVTWHYYRASFGFSNEDTIACAETAIRQALLTIGVNA